MNVSKVARLVCLLPQRPTEFWDRLVTAWESRTERFRVSTPTYDLTSWQDMTQELGIVFGVDADRILAERQLVEIEELVREAQLRISTRGPFHRQHSADFRLARLCYLACRARQPETVVETGVAYGVTTSFILAALERNRCGRLYSIDLPPLGSDADQFVGRFVPQELRGRWKLHRGTTRRVLPPLLEKLGRVDIFIHDSLHTYANMRAEFELASARLNGKAIVISDDVQGNPAFAEWIAAAMPFSWGIAAEESKPSLFGVGVIQDATSARS